MMLQVLDKDEHLSKIQISDVTDNQFSICVDICCRIILEKEFGLAKDYSMDIGPCQNVDVVKSVIEIQDSLINCLKAIDSSIRYIISYNGQNRYFKHCSESFYEFAVYHYYVACHRVSTVKDLYFKLINEIYDLGVEKCNWKTIKENREKISNPNLFEILNENQALISIIENVRNSATHEGKLQLPISSDSYSFLKCSDFKAEHPECGLSDEFSRQSDEYEEVIFNVKKELLDTMSLIRYNVFAATKCFFCSLSIDFLKLIKDRMPHIWRQIEEDYKMNCNNESCDIFNSPTKGKDYDLERGN